MKKHIGFGIAILVALITLTSLVGCSDFHRVVGSKNIETKEFTYSGFNRIEVSSAFTVDITRSDTYHVSVTLNDNLLDELDISISGDTLRIRMNPFLSFMNTTQHATISMPELKSLVISGASRGVVSRFQSDSFLNLEVSGASQMEIHDLKAADTDIQVSGVSRLSGSLITKNGDFEISGVSNIDLNGSAATVRLEVSGASHAKLVNFIIGDASVEVSGASHADVEVNGILDLDLSGASTLIYGDSPKLGRVEVSGASTLTRR
jgi:hypothetical protein